MKWTKAPYSGMTLRSRSRTAWCGPDHPKGRRPGGWPRWSWRIVDSQGRELAAAQRWHTTQEAARAECETAWAADAGRA